MSVNAQHVRKHIETHAMVVKIVVDDLIEKLGTVCNGSVDTGNSLRVRRPLVRSLRSITLVSVLVPSYYFFSLCSSHRLQYKPNLLQKQETE